VWWAATAPPPGDKINGRGGDPADAGKPGGGGRRLSSRARKAGGAGQKLPGPSLTYLSGKNSRKAGTIRWLTNSQDDPSLNSRPVTR
jgi:hypothetical protein